MLKIESILEYIRDAIMAESDRFQVIDDEQILDVDTGVKLHVYDDWFKVTRDDEVVATMRDFDTGIEQPLIWEIKSLITDSKVMEKKKEDYMPMIKERRKELSELFESPMPIESHRVVVESDAEDYTG